VTEIGARYGTTGMLPVIHSLWLRPWRICGPDSFQPSSRFLRATAVRMKRPATRRASGESGTVFGGTAETFVGFSVLDESVVPLVLGTNLTIAATTPAARRSAANHGSSFSQRSGRGSPMPAAPTSDRSGALAPRK